MVSSRGSRNPGDLVILKEDWSGRYALPVESRGREPDPPFGFHLDWTKRTREGWRGSEPSDGLTPSERR